VHDSNRSQRRLQRPGVGVLSTALVLLLVSLSWATGSGRVICRGTDGHMALELSRGGACVAETSLLGESESGVALSSARAGALDASCCGSCDDVALSSGDPALRKDAAAPDGPASPHLADVRLSIAHLFVKRPGLAVRDFRVASTLASIRTIAIRC